jgi:hypothetical protein
MHQSFTGNNKENNAIAEDDAGPNVQTLLY